MQKSSRIVISALVAAVLLTGATVGCSKRGSGTGDAVTDTKITRGSAAGTTKVGGTRIPVDVNPEDIIPPDITGEVPPIKVSVDENGTTYINDIPVKREDIHDLVESIARDYQTASESYVTLPSGAESYIESKAPATVAPTPADPDDPDDPVVPDDPTPTPGGVTLAEYTKTGSTALAISGVYLYSNDRPGAIMRDTYSQGEVAIVNVECNTSVATGGVMYIVPHDTAHAGDYAESDCIMRMSFTDGVPSGDNLAFIFQLPPDADGVYDLRFTYNGAEEGCISVKIG